MKAPVANPITPFLSQQGFLVLDGGLATRLEAHGCDLSDSLWSARLLFENPAIIRRVHGEYLQAGADCITSASYQATLQGFARHGFTESESADLIRLSVRLARDARDEFWQDASRPPGRLRPMVAASIGPYGAYLADGSEYTGKYGIGESALYDFHRDRWEIISRAGPDVLACETIPSQAEVAALARLLSEADGVTAWVSFNCRDGRHLADGSSLAEAVGRVVELQRVVAVGVNCIPPAVVLESVRELSVLSRKPIVVYPNSGEGWDAAAKRWAGSAGDLDFGRAAWRWYEAGARLIGGCCRTGPEDVSRIRSALCGLLDRHHQ